MAKISPISNFEYYPPGGSSFNDSLDLSKNFLIESRQRSLKPDLAFYGLIANVNSSPNETICFFLEQQPKSKKPLIRVGINTSTLNFKIDRELFSGAQDIDLTAYHKLQIKKAGEYIKFSINDTDLFETDKLLIRTRSFRMFVGKNSNLLVDYLSYFY